MHASEQNGAYKGKDPGPSVHMSAHAMGEMAEDKLDVIDGETAICNGKIARMEKNDPREQSIS